MKNAFIVAGVVGAWVLYRRAKLGHMPTNLRELLSFGACCDGCAAGKGCGGSANVMTAPAPRTQTDMYQPIEPGIVAGDGAMFSGGYAPRAEESGGCS